MVRHELGICAGKRRVDVAVINGELSGWEIKSDVDTLRRLAGQVTAYSSVLDRAVLVTTDRWLDHANSIVPEWWGVAVARDVSGSVMIEEVRSPTINEDGIDPFALAQLLWRDEALAQLRVRGAAGGLSGKARHYVWERLATVVPIDELRQIVRATLRARQLW